MIKLIAADMDGTLIGADRKISKENIEAIKKAQGCGVKFAIATGRAFCDVKPFLDEYNLKCDCLILNGAEYLDEDGNIIESVYIDKYKVDDILNAMKRDDISTEIYTDDGFYTTNTKEETMLGMIKRAKSFHPELSDDELMRYAKESTHFINMKYIKDLEEFVKGEFNIAKFVSFAEDENTIKELMESVKKIDGLAVSGSFKTNIEVNHIDAEKGKILAKVIKKMDIERDEVMVIGDGLNDYSMFTEFKNSFAMGNAVDEIKEVAKYITESNANSGVAKAIYRALNDEI